MDFELNSEAFDEYERIPDRFTTEGEDVSPPLTVSGIPDEAESLVLICDDPDAPQPEPWVHWLIWNIPATTSSLPEGISSQGNPDDVPEAKQGVNDFGNVEYGGPAPPPGHGMHHYRFSVYALDTELDLPDGSDRERLEDAMEGHIIDESRLTGTYERT